MPVQWTEPPDQAGGSSGTLARPTDDARAGRVAVGRLPAFWSRVRAARHVTLFLDYDGTLAPFHVDRLQAEPLPGTIEALRAIVADGLATVAIVSGRPIHEILHLLGDLPVAIVGAHGYEVRDPSGAAQVIQTSPEQAAVLDAAYATALQLFDTRRVERKAASVAAHFRGLDPRLSGDIETELERRWRGAGTTGDVEFRPFNGGIELRAAGRTKGTAILELLQSAPSGALPIYIGDDDTDEDAFAALAGHGIGIKVGPSHAVTRADGNLPNCDSVLRLLQDFVALRSSR
jgi:trehalose-phosphatase